MTLYEVLRALHAAAATFKGGTALTPENASEAADQCRAFIDLVRIANRKGASAFEITRAYEGEFFRSA